MKATLEAFLQSLQKLQSLQLYFACFHRFCQHLEMFLFYGTTQAYLDFSFME